MLPRALGVYENAVKNETRVLIGYTKEHLPGTVVARLSFLHVNV